MTRPKPPNRITCTKCGVSFVNATVQQMIEWNSTHVCPPPTLSDEVAAGLHDQPHP